MAREAARRGDRALESRTATASGGKRLPCSRSRGL